LPNLFVSFFDKFFLLVIFMILVCCIFVGSSPCVSCSGPSSSSCTECPDNMALAVDGSCVTCGSGFYYSDSTSACGECLLCFLNYTSFPLIRQLGPAMCDDCSSTFGATCMRCTAPAVLSSQGQCLLALPLCDDGAYVVAPATQFAPNQCAPCLSKIIILRNKI
jgi:hypothetical protein